MLDPQLLELLACPRCKGELVPTPDHAWLVCTGCGVRYPVRDDIPILLIDEAQPISDGAPKTADGSG